MDLNSLSSFLFIECYNIFFTILFSSLILFLIIRNLECLHLNRNYKNSRILMSKLRTTLYPYSKKIDKYRFGDDKKYEVICKIFNEEELNKISRMQELSMIFGVKAGLITRKCIGCGTTDNDICKEQFNYYDNQDDIMIKYHSNNPFYHDTSYSRAYSIGSSKITESFYFSLIYELFDDLKDQNSTITKSLIKSKRNKEIKDLAHQIKNALKITPSIDLISTKQIKKIEILIYQIAIEWLQTNDTDKIKDLWKVEGKIIEIYRNSTSKLAMNHRKYPSNKRILNFSKQLSIRKRHIAQYEHNIEREEQFPRNMNRYLPQDHSIETNEIGRDEFHNNLPTNQLEALTLKKLKIICNGLSNAMNIDIVIHFVRNRHLGFEREIYSKTVKKPLKRISLIFIENTVYPLNESNEIAI